MATVPGIVLHGLTEQAVAQYLRQPAHALLLAGPAGTGKLCLSQRLAAGLLGCTPDSLASQAYYQLVTAGKDKSGIGIEAVRELQQSVKLVLPGIAAKQVVIIEDAHGMTAEAQNALLKLLEEPPKATYFLLTTASTRAVLPTIRSRCQLLNVCLPSSQALEAHFASQGYDSQAVRQAAAIAGGLPGLMRALLDDTEHPMKTAVATARRLLQATQFERLALVDGLAKQKAEALHVLAVLQHMAHAAMAKAAQAAAADPAAAGKSIRQWHKVMRAAYDAQQAYTVSAQAKLTMTVLMLSL